MMTVPSSGAELPNIPNEMHNKMFSNQIFSKNFLIAWTEIKLWVKPAAMNVAPATSGDKRNSSQIRSKLDTK